VISAVGTRPDGQPLVVVGVTTEDATRVLAGEPILVDTEHVYPLLPPVRVVLMGGASNEAMLAELRGRWPEAWVQPSE
jgi:hypothetical protein